MTETLKQYATKVPEVTLVFWILKIAATTLGEWLRQPKFTRGSDAEMCSVLNSKICFRRHCMRVFGN